jgi:triosephosphate isomerase
MLGDVGCSHVILGHSERREYFHEDDALINKKIKIVLEQGLVPIFCLGEQLSQREAGQTFEVVQRQLKGGLADLTPQQVGSIVIAYEPVWAIGTGKVATTAQAQEVHQFLRNQLREIFGEVADRVRIQYGGSVKPDNISGLMAQPDIDGALVGGASLDAQVFIKLLQNSQN